MRNEDRLQLDVRFEAHAVHQVRHEALVGIATQAARNVWQVKVSLDGEGVVEWHAAAAVALEGEVPDDAPCPLVSDGGEVCQRGEQPCLQLGCGLRQQEVHRRGRAVGRARRLGRRARE
eukprot:598338-Pleurochrysis_carterae.AAC.2